MLTHKPSQRKHNGKPINNMNYPHAQRRKNKAKATIVIAAIQPKRNDLRINCFNERKNWLEINFKKFYKIGAKYNPSVENLDTTGE